MGFFRCLTVSLIVLTSYGCATSVGTAGESSPPEKHFSKGMWEMSVGGTAGVHVASNELVDRATSISLGPLYGYFVTEKIEVLGAVGIEYEEVEYEDSTAPLAISYTRQSDYSAAVGLQYTCDSKANTVPYAKVFFGMMNSRRVTRLNNVPLIGIAKDERKTTDPYFGLRVGVRHFIAKNISCDIGLGWQRVSYDKDFGDDTDDFSVIIGCAFFF
jgi:opacity protein-like surface antigen